MSFFFLVYIVFFCALPPLPLFFFLSTSLSEAFLVQTVILAPPPSFFFLLVFFFFLNFLNFPYFLPPHPPSFFSKIGFVFLFPYTRLSSNHLSPPIYFPPVALFHHFSFSFFCPLDPLPPPPLTLPILDFFPFFLIPSFFFFPGGRGDWGGRNIGRKKKRKGKRKKKQVLISLRMMGR